MSRVVTSTLLRLLPLLTLVSVSLSTSVQVDLHSKWSAPHLWLEISEYIATANNTAYFNFLDALTRNPPSSERPSDLYQHALNVINKESFLHGTTEGNKLGSSLLELTTALHLHAPRIESGYQYYRTEVQANYAQLKECEYWLDWHGHQACSIDELIKLANATQDANDDHWEIQPLSNVSVELQPNERILESTTAEDNLNTIIFYADITSVQFNKVHKFLVELTRYNPIQYVLRWKPPITTTESEPLRLTGYGVELALKSTEYLVLDDRENNNTADSSVSDNPDGTEDDTTALPKDTDIEEILDAVGDREMPVLKTNQLEGLGIKAIDLIINAKHPIRVYRKLIGDLPKYASIIARHSASNEVQNELGRLQALNMRPNQNNILINGVSFNPASGTIYQLLRLIQSEYHGVSQLINLGLNPTQANTLLSSAQRPTATAQKIAWLGDAYDVRDKIANGDAIVYLNDLESDSRYKDWPSELFELLRPGRPGQMLRISKNFVTVLLALDLSNPQSLVVVARDVLDVIQNNVPIRFSVIPIVGDDDQASNAKIAKLFYYFARIHKRKGVIEFLEKIITEMENENDPDVYKTATSIFDKVNNELATKMKDKSKLLSIDEILASESIYSQLAKAAHLHAKRLQHFPVKEGFMYVNGKRYTFTQRNYRSNLIDIYPQITPYLQQKMFDGVLNETTNIYDHFLDLPQVRQRLNPFIYEETPRSIEWIDMSDVLVDQLDKIKYIRIERNDKSAVEDTTLWIVTDFSTSHGIRIIRNALAVLTEKPNVRVALMHSSSNPEAASQYAEALFTNMAIEPVSEQQLKSFLEELDNLIIEPNVAYQTFQPDEDILAYKAASDAVIDQLNLSSKDTFIIINGRKIGPIREGDTFDMEDFELLVNYEHNKHTKEAHDYLSALFDQDNTRNYSDILLRAIVILGRLAQSSFVGDVFDKPSIIQRNNPPTRSMVTVGNPLNSLIRVQAVIDPMTNVGQKWAPILEMLTQLPNVSVQAFFNTDLMSKELPIKRFYRYLIPSHISFDDTTGEIIPDRIEFTDIPKHALLTMGLDVISAWVAMPTISSYDLDNIRLTSSSTSVKATFTLSDILVEGHVRDATPGNPRGLQLVFSPSQGGTIVMANLGYFQLRAPPGMYRLSLREGRSSEFYHLARINHNMWEAFKDEEDKGNETTSDNSRKMKTKDNHSMESVDARIFIDSLEGAIIFPTVKKNPGYEDKELLTLADADSDDSSTSDGSGIVGKLKHQVSEWFGTGNDSNNDKPSTSNTTTQSADINIFSVASGHLYERFLSVMMTSVMRHTKSTVKFWFIENFLSPEFKDFLPHLANKLGFKYELITYQWPHWLRVQTEKQRTIWGYKILFLDVLFPLDLDKVIFVDADQIVRADLQELVDLDLKGAPYGYTPFCSDREGMDRFRFWREGYWKNHLRGKPYHISALYVVDLNRFRAMAAGDILRGQYQALSADPNSLANLDQDLPNNLQDDVPIYSLPQEWLWCETWCSDEALSKAKTIDLCNNPLTKEPKLDRARRQVPEWSEYDAEITAFARELADKQSSTLGEDSQATTTTTTTTSTPATRSNTVEQEKQEETKEDDSIGEHDEL
ncbi:hypothetical protein BDF22DRAFT_674667 [Syncephalis plumigaleata]|nr:hypothetical protein BDF22DRAFT_674667 [Syncephalis plumigaleata]